MRWSRGVNDGQLPHASLGAGPGYQRKRPELARRPYLHLRKVPVMVLFCCCEGPQLEVFPGWGRYETRFPGGRHLSHLRTGAHSASCLDHPIHPHDPPPFPPI